MICGTVGRFHRALQRCVRRASACAQDVDDAGGDDGADAAAAARSSCATRMSTPDPDRRADRRDDGARRRGGAALRHPAASAALLSHSNFGSRETARRRRCARRWRCLRARARISRSTARCTRNRRCRCRDRASKSFPDSRLKGPANLLVMPTLDAANIALNLLKELEPDGSASGRSCSAWPRRRISSARRTPCAASST